MRSGKKTMYRTVSLLLILFILVGAIYYLTLALAVRNTLVGFRQAISSGDVGGLLHYIDVETIPKIMLPLATIGLMPDAKAKAKKYLTYLAEYFFDVDLEEDEITDFLRGLEVRRAFLWPGWRRCSVNAVLRYSSQGIASTKKVRIKLVHKEGEWFISGFTVK